jgi:ATP synthase F1 delta subunit
MLLKEMMLAKKYAIAFFNCYSNDFTLEDNDSCRNLEYFLKKNIYFYMTLRIPSIPSKTKKATIKKILHPFALKKSIFTLIDILLDHGRIDILHHVLLLIRREYNKRNGIEFFKITSSHPLTAPEKIIMKKLLQGMTNKTIVTSFSIDQSLIVGLRTQSMTSLWERSIRKELSHISATIAQKGMS